MIERIVSFILSGKRAKGLLIKANWWTVWVRLKEGNIIKRHKVKHDAWIFDSDGSQYRQLGDFEIRRLNG